MLKIFWKKGEIAPKEQFLLFSTIFCYLIIDFYVKIRIRFSFRDKRLFEIIEVEITRVDCSPVISCIILSGPVLYEKNGDVIQRLPISSFKKRYHYYR